MSKHWDPRIDIGARGGGRPAKRGRPQYRAAGAFGRRRRRHRNNPIEVMIVGGVVLGLAIAFGPQAFPGGMYRGPVETIDPANVWVIDGDTFDVGGTRVRIADIDTPEVRGDCAEESRLAARATVRMRSLLEAGPFQLEPYDHRDEDQYGRKLRVVTRDGRSLGDQLVAEGLARTWTGQREPWC